MIKVKIEFNYLVDGKVSGYDSQLRKMDNDIKMLKMLSRNAGSNTEANGNTGFD